LTFITVTIVTLEQVNSEEQWTVNSEQATYSSVYVYRAVVAWVRNEGNEDEKCRHNLENQQLCSIELNILYVV
jgi:hypothetical protein